MRQNSISCLCALLFVLIAAGLAHPAPAVAEIEGLTVIGASDIGPFRGKAYREVEARMEGSAPDGAYAVPVTLAFPKEASDHNGFAIVDVINTHTVGNEQWVLGGRPLPLARTHLGDDFLFGTGNAYVGVMWDKKTVDMLGNGTIAALADGYAILRDAAKLARNPADHVPPDAGFAPASGKIMAYGFSQTGGLLRGWYFDHLNSRGGGRAFDGAVIGGAGGACYDLDTSEWKGCGGAVTDGGKVISLLPETDVEWGGYAERGEHPDYRVVEIAGVSHIPATAADFRGHGMPEQNPVGFEPVARAALVNLQAWVNGTEPPPSIAIELSDAPPRDFDGASVRSAARDADGNAQGGLRLPHMPTVLEGGKKAGAPLGRYTGFAWDHEKSNFYLTISGTFTPFPPEKLEALYPDHESYVAAVAAAAADLVAKRYILQEDAEAYIEAAERSDMGQP